MKPGQTTRPVTSTVVGGLLVHPADGHDPSLADADVGPDRRGPGAVDHGAAGQQEIEHVSPRP